MIVFLICYALISLAQSVTIYKKNCKTWKIYVKTHGSAVF